MKSKRAISVKSNLCLALLLTAISARADSVPEPGLVMYGIARNTARGNARMTAGTLIRTITPAGGSTPDCRFQPRVRAWVCPLCFHARTSECSKSIFQSQNYENCNYPFQFLQAFAIAAGLLMPLAAQAAGLSEPGFLMYGSVQSGPTRITSGTLVWQIQETGGQTITLAVPLSDISGQYSYRVRVPYEALVGGNPLSSATFQRKSSTASFARGSLTVNG